MKAAIEFARTDSSVEATLQGLVNKVIDEKRGSVEFEKCLLLKFKDVTSSLGHVTKMTEKMLGNEGFIAPVLTIVRKETEKAVDVKSKGVDRRRKFV